MKCDLIPTIGIILVGTALDEAIYVWGIVPRLPSIHAVPASWWFLSTLPGLLAFLMVGFRLRTWHDVLSHGTATGLSLFMWGIVTAMLHVPGTHKSLFWEAPIFHWTLGPIFLALCGIVGLGLIFGLRQVGRPRLAAT